MNYLHFLTKKILVTNLLVTFFIFLSTTVTALPIKVSDSLEVTVDSSTEELNIETRYMTYYTVKGRGDSGEYGSFNIVEPVDKKLKTEIGSIEWKGLRPIIKFDPSIEFKTSKSKVEFNDILPVEQDWKNSEIAFQGANLLELATTWPSSDTEQNHALMLALLNLSILPEIIADGAGSYKDLRGSKGLRGSDTLNDFLVISGEIKNWKQNLKKWNAALSMTEALIEVLDLIAEEMEVDPNTIDSLRPVYDTLKVVQLISKKLEKVSGQFIPRDPKIRADLLQSISEQYKTAGVSTTGSTEKQVWKDVGKAYRSSDDKNDFIISTLLVSFAEGLRAWESKDTDEATRKRIKRERLLLGVAAIAFAGPDIIDIIENDPDSALQFITDISIGALQEVLSYENTSLIVQNAASKYLKASTSATISKAAKAGGKLLSAVKVGAVAGNRLIPYLYDLIGAPNKLSVSLNNGELSLFDPVEKRIQVIKLNTDNNVPDILWDSRITPTENPTVQVHESDEIRVLVSIQQNGLFGTRALWNTSSYVVPQNFFATYISQAGNYSATDSCLRKLGVFIDPLITIRRTNNNLTNPFAETYKKPQCADGSLNGNSDLFSANGEKLKLYNNDDLPIQYRLEGIDIENSPTAGMLFFVDEDFSSIIINTSGIGSSNPETVEIQLVEDDIEVDLKVPTSFIATRNGDNVILTWDAVEGADGYNLSWAENRNDLTSIEVESYSTTDTTLTLVLDKTKEFFAVIEAYNELKSSEESDLLEIPTVLPPVIINVALSLPANFSIEEGKTKFVPFTYSPIESKSNVANITCDVSPSILNSDGDLGSTSLNGVTFKAPKSDLIPQFTLQCKALSTNGSVLNTSNNLVVTVTQSVIVNNPPVAKITTSKSLPSLVEGDSFNLKGDTSSDVDGSITSYSWKEDGLVIGSSAILPLPLPSKSLVAGTRTISLTVTDNGANGGLTNTTDVTFTVKEKENNPPSASINGNPSIPRIQITVNEGESVTLEANSSSDPDSDTLTYKWLEAGIAFNETSSFSKVFDLGIHIVTLQVNDGTATSEAKVRVEVKEKPNTLPVARITSDTDLTDVSEGDSILLKGDTSSDAEGAIKSYLWEELGQSIGTSSTVSLPNLTLGKHFIKLTVTDSQDAVHSHSIVVDAQKKPTSDSFVVPAISAQGTEFIVPEGATSCSFNAEGSWSLWPYQGAIHSDANGYSGHTTTNFSLPTALAISLILKREDGSFEYVGKSNNIVVTPNETLYFLVNDVPESHSDNQGEQIVSWQCNNLETSLVAHYEFEGNANDRTINANHGIENGSIIYSNGVIEKAGDFDGINDYLNTINTSPFNGASTYTVSGWFNTLDGGVILDSTTDGVGTSRSAGLVISIDRIIDGRFNVSISSDGVDNRMAVFDNSIDYRDGKWHHYTVIYNGNLINTGISIYIDSIKKLPVIVTGIYVENSISLDGSAWSEAIQIGRSDNLIGVEFFKGKIDDLRIYNKVLSNDEITALYKQGNISTAIGKLNDTGITQCADNSSNTLACPVSTHPNQDAQSGRDVTHNDDSDGHAGFSFTKISSTGTELPVSATEWSCVKDNVTGLMWEVKTDDGGLHDKDNTYTWYNPDLNTNGGNTGAESSTVVQETYSGSGIGIVKVDNFGIEEDVECSVNGDEMTLAAVGGVMCNDLIVKNNTHQFTNDVNELGLCGASDWHLPKREELRSFSDYSPSFTFNKVYFPNRNNLQYVWSSNSYAPDSTKAWAFHSTNVNAIDTHKNINLLIRLVR